MTKYGRHRGRSRMIKSPRYVADMAAHKGGPSTMYVFHNVSDTYEVTGAGDVVFRQPFKIGVAGGNTLNYRFSTMYSNIQNFNQLFDEYKISGCKVTCHMTRLAATNTGSTTTFNMSPIVYVVNDPLGPYGDRIAGNSRVPSFANSIWNVEEIINDPHTARHYFRGDNLTFQHWVPFTEIVQEFAQWQSEVYTDNTVPDYLGRLGLEPRLHPPRWHMNLITDQVTPANCIYNHGCPHMYFLLANSNGQTVKMMFEYEFYVHFKNATQTLNGGRLAPPTVDTDNAGTTTVSSTRHSDVIAKVPNQRVRIVNGRTRVSPANIDACDAPPFHVVKWTAYDPKIETKNMMNTPETLSVPAPEDNPDSKAGPDDDEDYYDEKDMDDQESDARPIRPGVGATGTRASARGPEKIFLNRCMTNVGLPPVGNLNLNKK